MEPPARDVSADSTVVPVAPVVPAAPAVPAAPVAGAEAPVTEVGVEESPLAELTPAAEDEAAKVELELEDPLPATVAPVDAISALPEIIDAGVDPFGKM